MQDFLHKIEQSWIDYKILSLTGNNAIREELKNIYMTVKNSPPNVLNFLDIACKVLISGMPGLGKTALAYELANKLKHNKDAEASVYEVQMSKLISSKMGETANNITQLFDEINKKTQNYYCVIIMDEIEVFFLDRSNTQEHPDMNRALAELMVQLDKASQNKNLYTIAITNHPEKLDPAIRRRFSFHYKIELPKTEDFACFFSSESFPFKAFFDNTLDVNQICNELANQNATFDHVKNLLRGFYIHNQNKDLSAPNFLAYIRTPK
jgi:SpoVK/Ycf46/Vps4 family AAA+-type ATPase